MFALKKIFSFGKKKQLSGFTLIELMIVISIIAILATIVLAGLGGAQKAARDTQRQQMMNSVRAALERYYGDNGSYPAGPWYSAAAVTSLFNGATPATGALDSYMSTALADPTCGAALGQTNVKVAPYPCSANITTGPALTGAPAYLYTTTVANFKKCAAGYELELKKESGGSSFYCPPN